MIIQALESQKEIVFYITQTTIDGIYPNYYPMGAVQFFKSYHKEESILHDIQKGYVYLVKIEDSFVGTVTIKENEICRLFVLPQHQKNGYGKQLIEFAEETIGNNYSSILLDASLPAKKIYQKRGYKEVEYHQLLTENGDFLCYDVMKKELHKNETMLNYDGKIFVPQINSKNGEVDSQTIFEYHQSGTDFSADYMGGDIKKGYMVGTVSLNGELDFYYQHLNQNNEIRIGKCHSIPKINAQGKIELYENWTWLNGDCSSGESVVIEQ
ncbi:MAG: GNAT family N-acetyltransferase [Bacillota bacterium]|nr:GNAT family N-acetyltransferase [Bacillota bacterium]